MERPTGCARGHEIRGAGDDEPRMLVKRVVQSPEQETLKEIYGIILSGGQSRRFGSAKAQAALDGRTLISHVVARLKPQVAELAIAGPTYGEALPMLDDGAHGGQGPLAGVVAGLAWAQRKPDAAWLQVAPCDMPFLPLNLVAQLRDHAMAGRPIAIADARHTQVGSALWPLACGTKLVEILSGDGKRSLTQAFERLDGITLDASQLELSGSFDNINTIEDLARANKGQPEG